MAYSGSDLRNAYSQLSSQLSGEEASLGAVRQEIVAAGTEVQRELDEAARALAAIYVPDLSVAALAEAEKKTGFRGYSRFDPLKAMERERVALTRDVAAIEQNEMYVRREYLVGPVGSITRRLAEATDLFDTWNRECQKFEGLDGFLDLVDAKYDTPEFENRWWTPKYWGRWAAGDRICAALGMNDFGDDVLPAYEKARAPREQWRGVVAQVTQERDAVLGLVKKHDDSVYRLQHLEEIYLDECHKALGVHLKGADAALLQSWAGEDRGLEMGLKKLSGLKAKLEYMQGLTKTVEADLLALSQRRAQAELKVAKYGRPKKLYAQYPDAAYPAKGLTFVQKAAARREKYRGVSQKIVVYDRYQYFDIHNDPNLWWFEMTGRPPGSYHPGLQGWYDRNPSVTIVHVDRHDHGHAVGAAVADRAHDDLGDLS